MTGSTGPIELGSALRALRHHADLSQRELAERAGVPASTVARIESGKAPDPKFRTVERLVAAAGGALAIGSPDLARGAIRLDHEPDELRDEAGRRYPAHLDVRRVAEAKDWWGAWWADWYNLPRNRWPREAPEYTFDLDRKRRDHRRRREHGRVAVARFTIERVRGDDAPDTVWRWVASDPTNGELVGWLGGFMRRRRIDRELEFVLCDIEVVVGWRRCGLGRRLIETVRTELHQAGVGRARVLIDEIELPFQFFQACGFILRGPQPSWLMLPAVAVLPRRS